MAESIAIADDINSDCLPNFKFLREERWTGKSGSQTAEPAVTLVVRHMFAFSSQLGTSPSTFQFDGQKGKYFMTGSTWRKILCLAMVILAVLHYEALATLAHPKAGITKGEAVMLELLGFAYHCFLFAFYWALFRKPNKLVEILNGVLHSSRKFRKPDSSNALSRTKVLGISSALICVCVVMAFTEAIAAISIVSARPVTWLGNVLDIEAWLFILYFRSSWNGTEVREYCFSCEQSAVVANGLGALIFLWLWWGELCWVCGYCMTICWSITIWSLLKSFHSELCRPETEGRISLKEIRLFHEICSLVDKINDVYGWTILFSVFTGITHLSVHIFTVFKEDAGALEKIGVLLSFVGFSVELWVAAIVHHEAKSIGKTMRHQFETVQDEVEDGVDRIETHNALVLVLQDLNAGNVGIKGQEFFTCTFGFIGTVLGTIATYSFIVIQLQT